jgi:hypothetical protein
MARRAVAPETRWRNRARKLEIPCVKKHRYRPRHSLQRRHRQSAAVALTACALAASATGILIHGVDHPVPQPDPTPIAAADLQRQADQRASRDHDRPAPVEPAAVPVPSPPVPPPPVPAPPPKPAPVAGLDQAQMDNAATIVRVAKERNLPQRAMVIAIATALQESNLYNQASRAVPESFRYPHQHDSMDADSVGLFQQRPSMGWGTVAELMDPAHSAGLFYSGLVRVPGWQSMALTMAAQAVQRSGFPWAYAKHESRAQVIVAALV